MSCYFLLLLLCAKPLGTYIAHVFQSGPHRIHRFGGPVERLIYRTCGIQADEEMSWQKYAISLLLCNAIGIILTYTVQRLQGYLPFNPQHWPAPSAPLAWQTAISFATNTDWQSAASEIVFSTFTQMLGFTAQNFLSAASGLAVLMAFIRGLARQEQQGLGNFWVDMVRGVIYILLPLSFVFALVLVAFGVVQSLQAPVTTHALQASTTQMIPMGPVASQVAITQLGTNGGGFFNTNAAHPLANPTAFTNWLEMLAILLLPTALCYTFGLMVKQTHQGWMLLATMLVLFVPLGLLTTFQEQQGHALIRAHDGNMEGKETRIGVTGSALWTATATASASGSTNSSLDAYTPLGIFAPLWLMQLGELAFGGIGSGIYSLVVMLLITVFAAGLMVGRSPEYLGKKIEPFEMKMASLMILMMPILVLLATSLTILLSASNNVVPANAGPHYFTELLYAFTSMANNNGSAMNGLNTNTPYFYWVGGVIMLMGRYWTMIPILAIAGSLVKKKMIPTSSGTLPTDTPLFVILLISIIFILSALAFLPALALGPVVEQLMTWGRHG